MKQFQLRLNPLPTPLNPAQYAQYDLRQVRWKIMRLVFVVRYILLKSCRLLTRKYFNGPYKSLALERTWQMAHVQKYYVHALKIVMHSIQH